MQPCLFRASNICRQCLRPLRNKRLYSASPNHDISTPPLPPPSSGAALLSHRRLVSLQGQDSAKLLQGLITANVTPDARAGFFAAFLTAPGKVLADAFIYPTSSANGNFGVGSGGGEDDGGEVGFLVEVDGAHVDRIFAHLKRHKLRAKVKLRMLDLGEKEVWSLWREEERWTAYTSTQREWQVERKEQEGEGVWGLRDGRAPGLGLRVVGQRGAAGMQRLLEGVEEAPVTAYHLRRYLRGVPEGAAEIPWEEALPMNYNFDLMGGIDFKKGCYLGQELTIRTKHTGVVRRRVLPVMLSDRASEAASEPQTLEYDANYKGGQAEDGADVRRDDPRKRATGKFIAGIGNVGLAMCRLEQMSDLKVSGEASSFSVDDRFTVASADGAKEVGIKAFVPDWLRGQIREPKIQKRVG